MKNTNLLTLIGVIIALTGLLAIAVKGCSEKKLPLAPTFTQLQMDSVKKVNAESGKIIDELVLKTGKLESTKDSLAIAAMETSKKLELQTLKVKVLTREAQLKRENAQDGGEISEYIAACDSLLPQIDSLMDLTGKSRIENRSLQSAYDSLLSTTSLRAARLEFDNSFLKEKFDTLAVYTLALEKSKGVSDKKAKKRVGVGPSGGVTYYSNKFQPYVGIGIHYSIIRL